jgi:ADP-L-glycero-D-manno-heptose 6-epimerase
MIILTGSQGFIGKNFLKKINDPIIEVEKDDAYNFISNFNKWNEVSLILHQGAISITNEKNITTLHHANVAFTLFLFEKAIKYGIPVKYASSASVYGNQTKDLKIINPLNYYAITKLQIDYFVQDNLDKFSSIQGFRYFNVYGNGEGHKGDQASPVSKFTKQIRETGKLKLFKGSDKFLRDFICVDDVIDVVLYNRAESGIYDLGTGFPVSFQEVAELVAEKEKGEIEYINFPDHLKGKYQDYTCADMKWIGNYKFKTVNQYLMSN